MAIDDFGPRGFRPLGAEPVKGDLDVQDRLTGWLREQLPGSEEVRVEGLDRVEFGHSAEMMLLTVVSRTDGAARREDVVLRMRPPEPGLLEPYDLQRQVDVLRALEGTPVRAPKALWSEPTGAVLGRPFFVMERLDGEVFELEPGAELDTVPGRLRRMCESLVDQLAAIHSVDLQATGLAALGDGRNFLDEELDHWTSEMRRVQKGPLPALERLAAELRERRPEQSARVTLVHGDPKPGNFAFVGDEVNAVFDWELADIGDPLCDVGYLELLWNMPVGITSGPSSMTADEFIHRYEERTGMIVQHREWYRAFQTFKITIIQFVGSMLFDAGHSDDPRFALMGQVVPMMTRMALSDLGIGEQLDDGPVAPREERIQATGVTLGPGLITL
jgi:aminoglycoside phosphotransferase (APT) family kinase protein